MSNAVPAEGGTGVAASLASAAIAVEPGTVAELAMTVHNTGGVVDQFLVEVLGPASDWVSVTPPVVALFPGSEAVVRLLFRPPRDSTLLAGEVTFGVKVTSETAPGTSTVEEGIVRVGAFRDVDTDLKPRTASGRRRARFDLVHENRGNRPTTMLLSGSDDETALIFSMAASVKVLPGHTHLTRVKVAAEKRFWIGPNRTRPFTLQSAVEGEEPTVVPGTFIQRPILSRRALMALAALLLIPMLALVLLGPGASAVALKGLLAPPEEASKQGSGPGPVPGPPGPEGPAGPAGPEGPAGSAGPAGPVGPAGRVGDKGAVGAAGAAGAQGLQGVQGTQGTPGSPGSPGSPGTQGLPGSPGTAGQRGATGAAGPAGIRGPAGATGTPGPMGPAGPQGPPGPGYRQQLDFTVAPGGSHSFALPLTDAPMRIDVSTPGTNGGTQLPTEVMYATVNYDAGSRQTTWIGVDSDATHRAGNTHRGDRVVATIVCGTSEPSVTTGTIGLVGSIDAVDGRCVIATLEVDPAAPRTLLIRKNADTSIIDGRFVVNIWS